MNSIVLSLRSRYDVSLESQVVWQKSWNQTNKNPEISIIPIITDIGKL